MVPKISGAILFYRIFRYILPDSYPVLWLDVEGVARLDAEGVVPVVALGESSVNPQAVDGVYIHHREVTHYLLGGCTGPKIGIGQEETLLRSEPVVFRELAVILLPHLEGVVGDIQTTVIGDVLAKRKAALADADNVVVGILLIGRDVHREQKVVVFLGTTAEKFLTCADGVKLSDVGLDRAAPSAFSLVESIISTQAAVGSSRSNDRSHTWRSRLLDARWCPYRRN